MPYVSIITPTWRTGGIDVLLLGAKRQTFKDFEVVLVDAHHKRRPEIAYEAALQGVTLRHVEPFDNPFPICSFARFINTGLTYARGEVVLFCADYTLLPPESVETHAKFHRQSSRRHRGLMCPHDYRLFPSLHPEFPLYEQGDIDRYAADVAAGAFDRMLFSSFERPITEEDAAGLIVDPKWGGADPKLRARQVHPHQLHLKHESIPLAAAIEINGMNEQFDGTNCYQDMEFSERLQVEWSLDSSNIALIVNPRHHFPLTKWVRPPESNLAILEAHRARFHIGATAEQWSIRERRAFGG